MTVHALPIERLFKETQCSRPFAATACKRGPGCPDVVARLLRSKCSRLAMEERW